jgi:hypothetical protein
MIIATTAPISVAAGAVTSILTTPVVGIPVAVAVAGLLYKIMIQIARPDQGTEPAVTTHIVGCRVT